MLYDFISINEDKYKLAVNQYGKGAPTSSTDALIGTIYMDENNGDLYKCIKVEKNNNIWENIIKDISPAIRVNETGTSVTTNIVSSIKHEIVCKVSGNLDLSTVTVTQNPGGKTYIPTSDGIVNGMISISPSMTIETDNPEVTLDVTYNADPKLYIDKKFSELKTYIDNKENIIKDEKQESIQNDVTN